ncbi:MAG: PAS domain S-box protein, partial [Dehalococcoidia bacterium]
MKKYDASIRRKVLTGAVVLAAVVTFIFGINALSEGLLVLAVVDLSVSAFSVGVILAMHKRPGSLVPNWAFTVIMTSFFVYLFASGGHGGTGLLFMLLIPLATPLFLGWKGGVAVSLVGLVACAGVAIWGSVVSPLPGTPAGPLLARMGAIYLVALVLAVLYDSGMQRAYREQTRAREALRQSEERYRTILEETGDGYFELDLAGNLVFANNAMMRLLGCSWEEATGLSYKIFAPTEEEAKDVFKAYNRMYKTGEPLLDYPSRIVRRDGSHGFGETSAFLIRNECGEIVGFRGVRRDITERRRAEEALRESEERYRTLFERITSPILVIDTDGNYVDCNEATLGFLECTRDGLIGKNVKDYSRLGSDEQLLQEHRRLWAEGGRIDTEHCVNGKVKTLDLTITPGTWQGQAVVFGLGSDITERRQAEEALKVQHAYFQQLFDGSPDAVVMLDTEDRVVKANRGFSDLFGYATDEAIGQPINYLVAMEEDMSESSSLSEAVLHGRIVRREVVRRRKDGSPVSVSVVGYPIRFNDEPVGIYVIYTDITERKLAEEKLQESNVRFDQLAEQSLTWIWEVDAQGRYTYASEVVEKVAGYRPEDVVGRMHFYDLHPEDGRMAFKAAAMEIFERKEPIVEMVNPIQTRDGGTVWVSTNGIPVLDSDGLLLGYRGSDADITRRKEAEEALRCSEERYRTILEEMEDSYFEVDLGGHVTFVNNSACRDLGYSKEELIGMSYKQFVAEDDIESVFRMFREVYESGTLNKGFSWKTIRKDGSRGFAETSVSPLRDDNGDIIGFRGVGRDVTEHRRMQEQLMLTDRLASIGQLTSGIAHELNNPLTGVIGFSDLLLRRDLPADVKEDLETVNREAKRTSTVVKGLLAFARQQEIEKTPLDINCTIEEVLRLRAYEQRVNNIEVDTRFAPDLPQISGNGAQLQQVFMNIIINAEHAMLGAHARGRLSIVTEWVGETVRASITDDGPGITASDMKRLFNPFFTTKEVGKGTGLGLSISHGIVTDHGGIIYAESAQGKGARFVVELPVDMGSNGGHV